MSPSNVVDHGMKSLMKELFRRFVKVYSCNFSLLYSLDDDVIEMNNFIDGLDSRKGE